MTESGACAYMEITTELLTFPAMLSRMFEDLFGGLVFMSCPFVLAVALLAGSGVFVVCGLVTT